MSDLHQIAFIGGGAVEFARQLKAIREEQGENILLLGCEGRFPEREPEVLTLVIQAEDFEGTTEELRQKIITYVPNKKQVKKAPSNE